MGKSPLAKVKGDTMEYNAEAFKVNPDADTEDLLKKMPGMMVDRGKVQAQGEDVKKVYVDGRPFFDRDPTLALRSLPAEVVQKIEVFDEQSEQAKFTGFDDGETVKVLNIITRLNMRNGQFGKLYAGGGMDDVEQTINDPFETNTLGYNANEKYRIGGNVNFFDDDRRISVIGQSNNINQQNFSTEDLLGVTGSSGGRRGGFRGGGGRRPGGGGRGRPGSMGITSDDFMVGTQPGVSQTHSLGINYSDAWGDKISTSGSYFFNQSGNQSNQSVNQNYFSESDRFSQVYNESAQSESNNMNHRFHLKMEYDINENNKLMIRPRFSLQSNKTDNAVSGQSLLGDSLVSLSNNQINTDAQGFNFSNEIFYMHRFGKPGRTISTHLNTKLSSNDNEGKQRSMTELVERNMVMDSLNQFSDYATDGNDIMARMVYTEPISNNGQLMLTASSSMQWEDADKSTYHYNPSFRDYNLFDTSLSNVFKSQYTKYQFGTGYKYRSGRDLFLIFILNYQHTNLQSDQEFPENYMMKQSYDNLVPLARIRYKISTSKNINLFYRGQTQSPGIGQLQNTIDNSNPLKLTTGNPDLEESYRHNLFMRYSSSNTAKARIFFIMGRLTLADNYITNHTIYAFRDSVLNNSITLQQGSQLTVPVNLDNYWNATVFTTYGFPISLIKSNLNINLSYNYSHRPGMINNNTNYSNDNRFGAGLVLSSNISEKVDFSVSSNTSYNIANNTLYQELNDEYIYQKTGASLNLIFWKGMVFNTQVTHQYYSGLSKGFDESYYLWNLSLGKKLFQNQQAEIKLSVYDVLNQNKSVSRNVTDAYIEDTRTNVLQRYFMLSFRYNLRNFGGS